jgi:hypothetical protein
VLETLGMELRLATRTSKAADALARRAGGGEAPL